MRRLYCLFGLLLTACAPESQPYVDAPQSVPVLSANHLQTADNVALPSRQWLPHGKPKAILIALHGFNDYSHAFESSGAYFAQHRIALFAYDQRGFGGTAHSGLWAGEPNLLRDLKQYTQALIARYPHTPVYLLGESMGGAVVAAVAADPDFPPVRGIVLEAPALWGGDAMNPFYRGVLWTVAHTIPSYQFTGSDLHILASDNIPMLRLLASDPLVIKSTRADAIYGMMQMMDSAYDKIPDIKIPALLLYGGCDQVIPRGAIDKAKSRFTAPLTYAYYPGGYHMLLRDLEGQMVDADIVSWILHPQANLPSGYGPDRPDSLKALDHKHCLVLRRAQDGSHDRGLKGKGV